MSELEQILARSKDPGAFVERRRFTLARDKALEKLRSFALRHPRQYVLELVQCAVFAGASWIAVDVDHDRMVLAWVGGKTLQEDELANVFDYLFAARGREEHRHLVQLAIGVNAILSRRARSVRIESGDGTVSGTLRVDLDRKGSGHVGRPQVPMAGTYVLAEFSGNWLARLAGDTHTEEEALVEERCRYTPVPILLNGRAPFGYKPSTAIRMYGTGEYEVFSGGGRRGYIRAPVPSIPSEGFQIVVGGVRVCTLDLPQLGKVDEQAGIRVPMVAGGELSGVICDDRLRKTADQADIVRDRRFVDMLASVQGPASTLIRRLVDRPYEPPRLPAPEVVDERDEEAQVLPLPDLLVQVPPRAPLTHAQLTAHPLDEPLFWVRRDDLDKVTDAVAPHRFPHAVLVLEPGHLPTFDGAFPGRSLSRLTNAGDVEFVRRALERGVRQLRETVQVAPGHHLTLTLRMHGPPVRFGPPDPLSVPLTVVRDDGLERLRALELALPGVSGVLHLDPGVPFPAAEEETAWVLEHAWRLLPLELGHDVDPSVRRLACALLCAHARPHFVREHDAVRLEVGLPAEWGRLRESLQELELAATTSGPLTLPRWVALMGSSRTVELLNAEDLRDLQRLELRLGVGHLLAAPLHTPLVAVAQLEDGWRSFSPDAIGPVEEVLWFDATLAPRPPAGRTLVPTPVPGLGRLALDPEADWRDGALALLDELVRRLRDERAPDALLAERVRTRLQLAALQLAAHLGLAGSYPLLSLPGLDALSSWQRLAQDGVRVLPRHGLTVDEDGLLELSYDELVTLERVAGRVPLRVDDSPALWDSLAEPEHPSWLLRQEVQAPGLSGWLGLRIPFDDTVGIVLRSHGKTVMLPGEPGLACHGMLWLETSQPSLNSHQLELLRLARHQLLHRLSRAVLEPPHDPDAAKALRRYGMLYVAEAPHSVLAQRMAPELEVQDASGRRWGTLAAWLDHPADQRPSLPVVPRHRASEQENEEPVGPVEAWARRLAAATEDQLGHWELLVLLGEPRPGAGPVLVRGHQNTVIRVVFNPSDAEVKKAQLGVVRSQELVLLEAARRVAAFGRPRRLPLDLGALQRVLVAQRLG